MIILGDLEAGVEIGNDKMQFRWAWVYMYRKDSVRTRVRVTRAYHSTLEY